MILPREKGLNFMYVDNSINYNKVNLEYIDTFLRNLQNKLFEIMLKRIIFIRLE